MKIAIIGTGVAGNVAAYSLRKNHEITVFEADNRVGGHTNTVAVADGQKTHPIDTGFIVYNDRTYPNFIKLLAELGQQSCNSEMSFSVRREDGALEYKGSTLNALFAQRRNLIRPSFHRMIRDILRFNRDSADALNGEDDQRTVGEYLLAEGYSEQFYGDYLVPMAAAIWSADPRSVLEMPLRFLLQFFANHGLLSLKNRPQWKVIEGGSHAYVDKLIAGHRDRIRLDCAVDEIRRQSDGVEIRSAKGGTEYFDAVFVACHSDQALAVLQDATRLESDVLSRIRFQRNEAVLHTDESVLPERRRAWAAWNYYLPREARTHVAVTYNMNILQGLQSEKTYCVTLNDSARIAENSIIKRVRYDHPVFSSDAVAAQRRQHELNSDRTFFCGAYWRNGFHEDGVVSALAAVQNFEEVVSSGKLHLRRAG